MPSRRFRASLRSPDVMRVLDILSTYIISHYTSGSTSLPRLSTIRTVMGYRLNRFTSLMYTIFTLLPCSRHNCISYSLWRKYLECYNFSRSMEWVSGTLSAVFITGLYSLQSCLISGYFFLVSSLIFFLRMIAMVIATGCSFRMGT